MACVADRDAAVREVAQVYELIKLQQPLLLLHSQQPPSSTTQLAQSLLGKALRALNVALSVMNQQQPPAAPVTPLSSVVVKAEPQLSPPSPASADSDDILPRRGAKRRRSSSSVAIEGKKTKAPPSSSWSTVTAVPYDDGYEWRKYGEKKINGTLFTRSYFRCTYKDQSGCLATKHVQQMDMDNNSDNPAMFHVTYNNDHTCNNTSANNSKAASAKGNIGSSSSSCSNLTALLLAGGCNMKQEPTAAMKMKQEPQVLLPALVDLQPPASACFPREQIPRCQEPLFPVTTTMEQQFSGAFRHDDGEIPSASGSCISGETTSCWDIDMAAAAAQDDPLHDLERFLFMDY